MSGRTDAISAFRTRLMTSLASSLRATPPTSDTDDGKWGVRWANRILAQGIETEPRFIEEVLILGQTFPSSVGPNPQRRTVPQWVLVFNVPIGTGVWPILDLAELIEAAIYSSALTLPGGGSILVLDITTSPLLMPEDARYEQTSMAVRFQFDL